MLGQALHRVGFRWTNAAAVEIEVMRGAGVPMSSALPMPLMFAESELQLDEFAQRGVPAMVWRSAEDAFFEPFQLREHTSYWVDASLPAAAASEEDSANPCWPFAASLSSVLKREPRRRWRADGERLQIGAELRLLGHAGILDLSTAYTGPLRAEVVPRKLHYGVEYRALLVDLSARVAELLLRVGSPVGLNFSRDELSEATVSALHFQLRAIFRDGRFQEAMGQIFARMHSRLATRKYIAGAFGADSAAIDPFDSDFDGANFHAGGPLTRFFRGRTPLEFEAEELEETADTAENRFVKSILGQLGQLLEEHIHRLNASGRSSAAREAAAWLGDLENALAEPVWRQVGELRRFPSNSTILQRRAGYREINLMALSLKSGLQLHWGEADVLLDGVRGDIRPLSELYEFWCYFVLAEVLSGLGEEDVSKGTLFEFSEGGLEINLKRGRRSRRVFNAGGVVLELYYNRSFRRAPPTRVTWDGSYTVRFDPDFSLCVRPNQAGTRHWLHFDAKYRIEKAPFSSLEGNISEEGVDAYNVELFRLYSQSDLFKMHTYRDGILGSRGAYILFPGDSDGSPLFVRKPGAQAASGSSGLPSVGAFNLRPAAPADEQNRLAEFLGRVIDEVRASTGYAEELGLI